MSLTDGERRRPIHRDQMIRRVLFHQHFSQHGYSTRVGLEHALAVRIFLTHFEDDYETMNRVYAQDFPPQRRPARTCVGVTALARGARIEIDLIARRP